MSYLVEVVIDEVSQRSELWVVWNAKISGGCKSEYVCELDFLLIQLKQVWCLIAEGKGELQRHDGIADGIPFVKKAIVSLRFDSATLGNPLTLGPIYVACENVALNRQRNCFKGILAKVVVTVCDQYLAILHDSPLHVRHRSCSRDHMGHELVISPLCYLPGCLGLKLLNKASSTFLLETRLKDFHFHTL